MLEVQALQAGYGQALVLRGVGFSVSAGEVLCVMGRNGAGKTTTMKAIMGLVPAESGSVMLDGEDVTRLPAHQIPGKGIGYIPQGRRLFGELTVAENIEVGLLAGKGAAGVRERMLELFPPLASRLDQRANTLSGGEQQMLATARALCVEPKVLLLDEPTEGLQPSMIAQIQEVVRQMRDEGKAVVLVEQRVEAALSIADRVVFVENGQSREVVEVKALRADGALLDRYVGV